MRDITTETAIEPDKAHERKLTITLWLVATGFFMQTLDTTIVNTALPAMARSLGELPLRMQSVVVAYSLTMALMIPVSGFLADRLGMRRVFFAAILVFTVGSLFCASSRALWQLVASRVLQGVGGAMLLPVGRLAILRTFPRERYLAALSFVAIPGLVGPLIGPTLGGWLTDVASWHWVFLINVPVGVVGCAATALFMLGEPLPSAGGFDIKGYAMLALAMLALTVALDGLAELGLQHAIVLVLLIFAFACLTGYALHAARSEEPLFSLDLFQIPTFRVGLLGNLFARIGSGAMPYLLPLLLQVSLGYSPFHAGLMMLPAAAAGMASKRIVVELITRYGYRSVLLVNTVIVGLTMASFALVAPNQPIWVHIVQFAIFGGFNSMQFTAMNTLTLKDLGTGGASSGNSLFSLAQMLSMSLGVTVAGALLGTFTSLFGHQSSNQTLVAFHATYACVGVITASSAWIFAQLAPDTRGVSGHGEAHIGED
ncbi:EmrB/QacA subfamily drug resistance transporter [Trinickia symbiotica]|uniref:MFS transporter n=1 Tax=Trinickia symbiotica TaxID=863227 RepID=A0A2N7XB87_9BURK|nr:multidrug transporter subunit MdtD [Trinickia symbiotica]PMS38812.1 MFS transporter [Trinickia symbiotica]PPK46856.1 EmrB/QacA subfamily drug resistance transporter [Trinickia symbiotica]